MKKTLCILVIFALTISLSACISKRETQNIDEYYEYLVKVRYAEDYMPGKENCGNYSSIYATYKRTFAIFETFTVGLFLSYDEAVSFHTREKAKLSAPLNGTFASVIDGVLINNFLSIAEL